MNALVQRVYVPYIADIFETRYLHFYIDKPRENVAERRQCPLGFRLACQIHSRLLPGPPRPTDDCPAISCAASCSAYELYRNSESEHIQPKSGGCTVGRLQVPASRYSLPAFVGAVDALLTSEEKSEIVGVLY